MTGEGNWVTPSFEENGTPKGHLLFKVRELKYGLCVGDRIWKIIDQF